MCIHKAAVARQVWTYTIQFIWINDEEGCVVKCMFTLLSQPYFYTIYVYILLIWKSKYIWHSLTMYFICWSTIKQIKCLGTHSIWLRLCKDYGFVLHFHHLKKKSSNITKHHAISAILKTHLVMQMNSVKT